MNLNPFKADSVESITSVFTAAANKLAALIITLEDTIVSSVLEIEKHEALIDATEAERNRAVEVLNNINKIISKE